MDNGAKRNADLQSGDSDTHAAPSAAPQTDIIKNYPAPAARATQADSTGIRFDFNRGCRVTVPEDQDYTVTLRDLDTQNILFRATTRGGTIQSSKKFYVRFGIEVEDSGANRLFSHAVDLTGRDVMIALPVGTLGDPIAWFPYVLKFQRQHQCNVTCVMGAQIIPLLAAGHPHIVFSTPEAIDTSRFYATYYIGLFFDDAEHHWQPTDFRLVGLHRTAGYILGVDPSEERLSLVLPDETRPIPEPYVCIAVQASTHAKKWNNPHGWSGVVRALKDRGYRVICIDREATHGAGLAWTHMPHGAEDHTGAVPLVERARWLRHATGFIGVSSGLAWLAWSVGTPVVMISGFTHPANEFDTPGRVINWHVCNSCWNDVRHRFDHGDYLWCPRHQGTDRHFECSRLITSDQVMGAWDRLPIREAAHPGS